MTHRQYLKSRIEEATRIIEGTCGDELKSVWENIRKRAEAELTDKEVVK